MSLFQKVIVQKYLKNLSSNLIAENYKKYSEHFNDSAMAERIKALKERLKALDQKKKKKLLELEKAADEEITFYSGKLNKKKYKLIETTNRIQELKQILSTEKEKLAGYKENIKINNRAIEKEDKIISELNEKLLLSLSESERKKKKQDFIESDTKKYRKEIQKRGAVDGDLYMMKDGVVTVPYTRIIIRNKTL